MKNASLVRSVCFNQDFGCFCCAMENGFHLYNSDPLKRLCAENLPGGIENVEMLFRCNYIAFIGSRNSNSFPSNNVIIWDTLNRKEIVRLEMNSDVKGVRLRRDRIVVVLETSIHIFSFTDHPSKLHVFESSRNPRGICSLCSSSDSALLVFPNASSSSAVSCIDLAQPDAPFRVLRPHTRPLAAIALNSLGTQLATASERGTIIRVFDTKLCTLLHELRRGANPAVIYCLNFSTDSAMLCASSDHNTVHLFALCKNQKKKPPIKRLSLPGKVSFSRFQLPYRATKGSVCICAFGQQPDTVIAVSTDGNYCKFTFDRSHGACMRQTCTLFLEVTE
ncbi:hypothetical protein AB6A40_007346 [Gnathostoma spinigerum]|uniref:WD repeat domain phosphoinositide-interacting protein 3 n=1 Tax=Gnathostoma spinigerum TaxID=75299 RepID=A0ABD6EN51_9BILA